MSAEEIIAGNKLIAEFMDGEVMEDGICWFRKYHHVLTSKKCFHIKATKYHTSWDWLMPVVEKIESIKKPRAFTVYIFNNHCRIGDCKPVTHQTSKIQSVYTAVLQFITWYNKQNQL